MALWSLQLRWLGYSQNSIEFSWLIAKKQCNSLRMAVVWIWYRWNLLSKIFLAAWMESVMMMILDTFSLLHAWLMPHLITKSSASILVMKAVWWTVLIKGWSTKCTCNIDVAMSFLMLASITMMAMDGEEDNCKIILSSCWKHNLSFFSLLAKLKENWSEKLSTILEPRKSSKWRGENAGRTPYNLLLELIRKSLMIVF